MGCVENKRLQTQHLGAEGITSLTLIRIQSSLIYVNVGKTFYISVIVCYKQFLVKKKMSGVGCWNCYL